MNARKVAANVLTQVLNKGGYSNIVLGNELNKSNLNDKDRALVTEIVYGTIKYKLTIDTIIASFVRDIGVMDKDILNILRMSIYQMRYLDKVPEYAVVSEAVDLSKKISVRFSKLVNGVLRNYIRNKDKDFCTKKDPVGKLSFKYSFDGSMVKLFISQYGVELTEEILKGLNNTPEVTVRVNSFKTGYDDVLESLEESGYKIEEGYICPEAIIINKGSSIEKNPEFTRGNITVQDESAMLVAPLMDLKEDDVAFDLCSAPGGKATHMGELLNNRGKIYAFDIHENKLSLISENASRLGLSNIEYAQMDAASYDRSLANKATKILIDVPCSGLGIIRKKPEIKWNKVDKEFNELINIQKNIMENASRYLKSGGVLVYSTCTLNKGENEENIKWFLDTHKDFKLEKVYLGKADNIIYHESGCVTILPNKYMDGFFIAKLRKQ